MKPRPEFAAKMEALRRGGITAAPVVAGRNLFPTPPGIARQVAHLAEIDNTHRLLEPSAGKGDLLSAALDCITTRSVVAVEINAALAAYLRRGFPLCTVHEVDFLECEPGDLGSFHRIVMNPPFDNGADIKHVKHALRFLKPGGRLVAIVANGPRQAAALQGLADRWIDLPPGSFKEAGTNVNTAIVRIDT